MSPLRFRAVAASGVVALLAASAVPISLGARQSGTEGPDTLQGRAGADVLVGLGGPDRLLGGAGPDRLFGGDGGDLLIGSTGADDLHGNAGPDRSRGGSGADTLGGGSGHDTLAGGPGRDTILGGDHGDTIGGGPGADAISGGAGPDVIVGGLGRDRLRGGTGRDDIRALDGQRDRVSCGPGSDRVRGDLLDVIAANCELVELEGEGLQRLGPVRSSAAVVREMEMVDAPSPADPGQRASIAWGHQQGEPTRVCLQIGGPAGAPVEVRFTDPTGLADGAGALGPDGSLVAQLEIAPEAASEGSAAADEDPVLAPFTGPIAAVVTIGEGASRWTLVDRYEVVGPRGGIDCDSLAA